MRSAVAILLLKHVVPTFSGLKGTNGLMNLNGLTSADGFIAYQGIHTVNAEMAPNPIMEWNTLF